jgi:hypothetical protein
MELYFQENTNNLQKHKIHQQIEGLSLHTAQKQSTSLYEIQSFNELRVICVIREEWGKADLPATWFYANFSGPITQGRHSSIKMYTPGRSKSRASIFTKFKAPLYYN